MNGIINLNNYDDKGELDINKDATLHYNLLDMDATYDDISQSNVYSPSANALSSIKPFNPFVFIQDDIVKNCAIFSNDKSDENHYNKVANMNNINTDYVYNNILNNVCIILESGFINQMRSSCYVNKVDKFNELYLNSFHLFAPSVNRVSHTITTTNIYDCYLIPRCIYTICEELTYHMTHLIRDSIINGLLDVKALNKSINQYSPNKTALINKNFMDTDVSMIISFLTCVLNHDIQKISELVEMCLVDSMQFTHTTNNTFNHYQANGPAIIQHLIFDENQNK